MRPNIQGVKNTELLGLWLMRLYFFAWDNNCRRKGEKVFVKRYHAQGAIMNLKVPGENYCESIPFTEE